MTARDINATILGLKWIVVAAIKKEGADDQAEQAVEATLDLLGTLLVDINRIADALEVIAHEARQPKD